MSKKINLSTIKYKKFNDKLKKMSKEDIKALIFLYESKDNETNFSKVSVPLIFAISGGIIIYLLNFLKEIILNMKKSNEETTLTLILGGISLILTIAVIVFILFRYMQKNRENRKYKIEIMKEYLNNNK